MSHDNTDILFYQKTSLPDLFKHYFHLQIKSHSSMTSIFTTDVAIHFVAAATEASALPAVSKNEYFDERSDRHCFRILFIY